MYTSVTITKVIVKIQTSVIFYENSSKYQKFEKCLTEKNIIIKRVDIDKENIVRKMLYLNKNSLFEFCLKTESTYRKFYFPLKIRLTSEGTLIFQR